MFPVPSHWGNVYQMKFEIFVLPQSEWQRPSEQLPTNTVAAIGNSFSHLKPVWRILKKLKINLPYDSWIPLLGMCSNDSTTYSRDTSSAMFISALLKYVENKNHLNCPSSNEGIMKRWYSYTVGNYSVVNKNEITNFPYK